MSWLYVGIIFAMHNETGFKFVHFNAVLDWQQFALERRVKRT